MQAISFSATNFPMENMLLVEDSMTFEDDSVQITEANARNESVGSSFNFGAERELKRSVVSKDLDEKVGPDRPNAQAQMDNSQLFNQN